MRTLVVSGYGVRLRVRRRCLVVEEGGERMVVPLAEIDRIVVVTSGVSITSSAVRALARYGVDIVFLDPHGTPMISLCPPWISASVETRLAQYRARLDPSLRLAYAKAFAQAKVLNQAHFLQELYLKTKASWLVEEAEKLQRLAAEIMLADKVSRVRSLEGVAAKIYWGAIASLLPPSLGFPGRDQDSADPVNTSLNYLYGLLYTWSFKALVVHGLDPYTGFLHEDRAGNPVLVFDYVEMFRVSAVDKLVYKLVTEGFRPEVDPDTGLLTRETRAKLVEEFAKWMRRRTRDGSGQAESLEKHLMLYARRLARAVRSQQPYQGFVEAVIA